MVTSEFGKRLRELRKRASLTQRELADGVGINFTYLSKIESGAMPPPSKKIIFRLADALNIDREELLILAGIIPDDVTQMLKNEENIKRLRKIGNRHKISLSNNKWGVSIMKNLNNRWGVSIMKNLMNYRRPARVALALILVVAVATSFWFAAPTPVKAVNFTFTPSQPSGYIGRPVSFSVKIDITNDDLLPIEKVDLHIGDSFPSPTYGDQFQNLPIPQSANTTASTTSIAGRSSTINVSATSDSGWGYGYGYGYGSPGSRKGYGYGYRSSTGWRGWGYWDFIGYGYGYSYGYGYGSGSFIGPASITYNVTWTPPSNWPAGTYQITLQVWGDTDDSLIGSTSLTLSTEPEPEPEPEPGVTDVSDVVDEEGVFTEEVIVESEDGNISITIDEGITGLTEEGEPISEVSIVEMEEEDIPPPPTGGNIIGITYDIGPDGAIFSTPITLAFTYDSDNLPDGVSEEGLVIAIWDEDAGEWVELPSVVDTENNTITATVSHFTAFAIVALPEEEVVPPVVTPPVVTPPVVVEEGEEEEEVVTPPVVVEEDEEEEEVVTPVVEADEGLAWWIWLIVGLGSVTAAGLLLYFLWYKPRRPPGYSRTD